MGIPPRSPRAALPLTTKRKPSGNVDSKGDVFGSSLSSGGPDQLYPEKDVDEQGRSLMLIQSMLGVAVMLVDGSWILVSGCSWIDFDGTRGQRASFMLMSRMSKVSMPAGKFRPSGLSPKASFEGIQKRRVSPATISCRPSSRPGIGTSFTRNCS